MNGIDTIDPPTIGGPPELPPYLRPRRGRGNRWIIVPDICRIEERDLILNRSNNWITVVWRWMVRMDAESGVTVAYAHTATRVYRQWLETHETESGISPHISFGGAIKAGRGDPTFHQRWQEYARATFA